MTYVQYLNSLIQHIAHLTPRNCGLSPGALSSDSLMRERTCVTDLTVAATNQGRPIIEQIMISTARTIKSRWYPWLFWWIKIDLYSVMYNNPSSKLWNALIWNLCVTNNHSYIKNVKFGSVIVMDNTSIVDENGRM